MFNFSHFQSGRSFEDVVTILWELKITSLHRPQGDSSTAPTHFDHDKSPKVIVMIVIEQAQSLPTVLHLSPWIQSAASTRVCVCALVCIHVCVPVRSPPAAGRCAGICERQCECVGVLVCLWDYEKLPACSAACVHCAAAARRRCGGGVSWGRHHSSPQTTLCLTRGGGGLNPVGRRG